MSLRVLVVEDDASLREALVDTLELADIEPLEAGSGEEALELLRTQHADMVVSDVNMPGIDGHQLLAELRSRYPALPVALITAYAQVGRAVDAMRAGAVDYLCKPFEPQQLINLIQQYAGGGTTKLEADEQPVAESPAAKQMLQLAQRVASTDSTVLITGESGTGKEVVARNIHNLSERAKAPFVPVNCGAIPGELLESELFGHEKGAFTGAISTRKGRFELAEGGTLFLDEIGDMPQPMQVKLLRVLQERTFERVGGAKSIKANVRIVAATHQHLEEMIKNNDFREDLYYRLNVFPIETPALRERKEDIPLLIKELMTRFEHEQSKSVRFTDRAIASLMEHPWSGNVRELSNLIERMIIMYGEQVVDVSELPAKYRHIDIEEYQPEYPEELQEREAINELFAGFDYDDYDESDSDYGNDGATVAHDSLPDEGINLKEYLADLEVSLINQALSKSDGVVARSAELLGMRRTTLVEKMKKYDLQK